MGYEVRTRPREGEDDPFIHDVYDLRYGLERLVATIHDSKALAEAVVKGLQESDKKHG